MSTPELLIWVRGPGLAIATTVFVIGMLLRLMEILLLGRRDTLAAKRASGIGAGFRTIFSRSLPADRNTMKRSMFTLVAGYTFHIGLFVALFLLAPHIELYESVLGVSWASLPTPVVDFFVVLSLIALMAILWHRITHPVLRHLSTFQDYLVWAMTFLPLATGYLAYHHLFLPYTVLLTIHIISVELLMIVFPFTKLTHTFTLFMSRWYNGMMAGQKGVQQ
jgi:nitrate reductase gamma subunit